MENYYFVMAEKAEIKDGDKFLIVKRSPNAENYPNHWDFPGGKLEWGENPKIGLTREIKEETGLDVEIIKPEFAWAGKVKNHYTFYLVFRGVARGNSKQVKLSHEHTEFRWATKEETLKFKIEPYLRAYLEGSDE